MKSITCPDEIQLGNWRVIRATGELIGADGPQRLEPKVADLLFLLAASPGEAVSRERIMEALWPGQVVGDDSLARAVFKLRQALGDDAKAPRYIETLSKRGYRLIADVTSVPSLDTPANVEPAAASSTRSVPRLGAWLALCAAALVLVAGAWWLASRRAAPERDPGQPGALTAQADDFYFQFTRGDNESAIELYERVLALRPDDPHALAGLANALVQRAIRWPVLPGQPPVHFTRLGDALAHGHLDREPASRQLERARLMAERAVAVAPESSAAHKAVGFVASAQGRFQDALTAYERAVELDPDAWGTLINIGDVLEITGREREALPYFERAYAAMERGYANSPVQIRPWHAPLGALIAKRHASRGDSAAAEAWYRRVLGHSPLHPESTRGLAQLMRAGGDEAEAERLCAELSHRVGAGAACDSTAEAATAPE
ncbi:tetratricopeptide repeat protein [Lysobacter korlensis]|uniref:Tetratricopeptide repeat protein n=1 Tax=Lysobacter korlensis TaxID=553636 RepID=A0ABV6RS39_9GAMM